MKEYFSYILAINFMDKSSWTEKFQFLFKNYEFGESEKIGAISWKIDIS